MVSSSKIYNKEVTEDENNYYINDIAIMRPENDDFDPQSEEEQRRLEEDEEFRRRVRREILRVQSGEADEATERRSVRNARRPRRSRAAVGASVRGCCGSSSRATFW